MIFLLKGKFTTKSDVWSFGVTLWEILTFAREQPYESLSDEKVIANLSSLYAKGSNANSKAKNSAASANSATSSSSKSVILLPSPHGCPREIRDLMCECWQRGEKERPSFREIHLFLQRKNLGYDPAKDPEAETSEARN